MAVPDAVSVVDLLTHGPHRFETGRKLVTLALGGLYIASTTNSAKPKLVWETEKGYGRYYIPVESLHTEIRHRLTESKGTNGTVNRSLANGHAPSTTTQVKIESFETVNGKGNDSKAVIEKLIIGKKSATWVRFLEGPFKDFIRFERHEIGASFLHGILHPPIHRYKSKRKEEEK